MKIASKKPRDTNLMSKFPARNFIVTFKQMHTSVGLSVQGRRSSQRQHIGSNDWGTDRSRFLRTNLGYARQKICKFFHFNNYYYYY